MTASSACGLICSLILRTHEKAEEFPPLTGTFRVHNPCRTISHLSRIYGIQTDAFCICCISRLQDGDICSYNRIHPCFFPHRGGIVSYLYSSQSIPPYILMMGSFCKAFRNRLSYVKFKGGSQSIPPIYSVNYQIDNILLIL